MSVIHAVFDWLSASDQHVATAVILTAFLLAFVCIIVEARRAPLVEDE